MCTCMELSKIITQDSILQGMAGIASWGNCSIFCLLFFKGRGDFFAIFLGGCWYFFKMFKILEKFQEEIFNLTVLHNIFLRYLTPFILLYKSFYHILQQKNTSRIYLFNFEYYIICFALLRINFPFIFFYPILIMFFTENVPLNRNLQ